MKTIIAICCILFFPIRARATDPPELLKNFHDYRGIIHCHGEFSHDSKGRMSDIKEAAAGHGIDFVIMTDHWNPALYARSWRGFHSKTLFIAGTEISQSHGMSILAFPLPEHFTPIPLGRKGRNPHIQEDLERNIAALESSGAIVLAGHIEKSDADELALFNGIELMNLHAHLTLRNRVLLPFDYFRTFLPWNWNLKFMMHRADNLDRWSETEAAGKHIPAILGTDTHDNLREFKFFGPKLAGYGRVFPLMSTHIWTTKTLSERAVLESLRCGRSYMAFDIFGNTAEFLFFAENGFGISLPGDTLQLNDATTLSVRLPRSARDIEIRIIKNGTLYEKTDRPKERAARFAVTGPGIYRVEIYKHGRPWILSNGISIQ